MPVTTVKEYLKNIPAERKEAFHSLRETILDALPAGFEETLSYGMIGYVVPHRLYPDGYHCDPRLPLPFLNLANQKGFIALYHMGLYADKKMLDWFTREYKSRTGKKPDMGKSCIRFKKPGEIPLPLIAELIKQMSPKQWIALYEKSFRSAGPKKS